jgi:aryl-alcohol dehydrogenase-like predicted oxidoreductase
MRRPGRTGLELSVLGLGGHEFLPDGRSRGFNEDYGRATSAGVIFPGFGGARRQGVVAAALAAGINFFDVTIDAEKEALGRNLHDLPPPREIAVQTRPEGMVYTNNPDDAHNWRMADLGLLRDEVRRGLVLLGRPRVDFLNLGFMGSAVEHDPGYLPKIARNVRALKDEGLIRFACADTFSGEWLYERQIDTGAFDGIFVNFNLADDGPARRILPLAADLGLSVHCRETFLKGELFRLGEAAGVTDRAALARAALRWVLGHPQVTTVVVGAHDAAQLSAAVAAAERPEPTDEDLALLDRVRCTGAFRDVQAGKRKAFGTYTA